MELPRRRMYGCEEKDAMTLFRAGAGRSMTSMYHHDIAAGDKADDDVLNLYGNGTATEHERGCHEHQQPRSSRPRSHVVDVATDDDDDDDDEIEQAAALRQRRQKQQQQQQVVAADAAATDAVLVAWDNQEVARQNAEAAQRNAEAAREHAELAMASAAPRLVAGGDDVAAEEVAAARPRHDAEAATQRDNDASAEAAAVAGGAHAEMTIGHVMEEVGRLRAEVARRGDEAAAGIVLSFAAALLAPILMAALLYYIFPRP